MFCRFTFPTPPPAKSILAGLETLYALKTIDKAGRLTAPGLQVAELPLKPLCGAALCHSGDVPVFYVTGNMKSG